MNIGIIGCGWLGKRLLNHLSAEHRVYVTLRNKKKLLQNNYFICTEVDFDDSPPKKWNFLSELDCIIITIPFGRHLSLENIKNRLKNISIFIKNFDKQLFFTSSVGIYPSINTIIDEYFPEIDLQPELYLVENHFRNTFPQVNILRLGGLMGDNRYLSKYAIPEPHQMVNHIHYEDVCLCAEKMITLKVQAKTYNLVAPQHPTKQAVINHQKGVDTMLESGYGKIISSEKIINELDYNFLHPNPIFFSFYAD